MNVVTLVDFRDNLRGVERKAGEEFVVTKERFEEINAVGLEKIGAPIVEEVVRTAVAKGKQTPESRAKRRRRAD
jgi:hypothetical protein